jgi:hypothetical protein
MQLAIHETKEIYEIVHSAEKVICGASKWQEHVRIECASPYRLWSTCHKFQPIYIYIHRLTSCAATSILAMGFLPC